MNTHADAIIQRLRYHYAQRTPLYWTLDPEKRPWNWPACRHDNGSITLAQFQRLCRCVITEGYGE